MMAAGSSLLLFPDVVVRLAGAKGLKQFKFVHRCFSSAVYTCAVATVILSFYSNWWQGQVTGTQWWIFTGLTSVTWLTVMLQVGGGGGGGSLCDYYLNPKKLFPTGAAHNVGL